MNGFRIAVFDERGVSPRILTTTGTPKAISYFHGGPLGVVDDARLPQPWEVIESRFPPPGDTRQRWDPSEQATADWMRTIGIDLEPIMRTEKDGIRLPDAAWRTMRQGWEIKNPWTLNLDTIIRRGMGGIGQSSRMVIARVIELGSPEIVGLTETDAIDAMSGILDRCGAHIDRLIIVLNGGDYLDYQR